MGKRKLLAALLTLALTGSAAGQLRRPASPGQLAGESILGHVLPSPGERALPSAATITVTLQLLGSGLVLVESVREGGRFDFADIPRGRYSVTVKCPGYLDSSKEFVVFQSISGEPAMLYINVGAREPGDSPLPSGTTVAAGLLSVPDKALQALKKAERASDKDKPRQAIEHLEKAISIHPAFAEAHNNLAVQHLKLGDEKRALEAIDESIRIQPRQNPMAYRNRGLIHLKNRDYPEAIDSLQASLDQEPQHAETLFNLGRAYFDSGLQRHAVEVFEQVLALQADNSMARFALGYACFSIQDFPRAARELRTFLGEQNTGPQADLARRLLQQIATR